MRKRIISWMLLLAMVLTIVPVPTKAASVTYADMLARAEAIVNYTWTPSTRISTWNGNTYNGKTYFEAGQTIKGMPYTLFYNEFGVDSLLSLAQYKNVVSSNYSDTKYCTSVGATRTGPVYGSCCATFVSEVFGGSFMSGSNPRYDSVSGIKGSSYGTTYYNVPVGNIQSGDALSNTSGGHIIWVGEVTSTSLTVYEQTPPVAKKTVVNKSSVNASGYLVHDGAVYSTVTRSKELTSAPSTNLPQGVLDFVNPGTNKVTVRGWAFDRDNLNREVALHVYIGSTLIGTGSTGVIREDVHSVYGTGKYHGYEFECEVPSSLGGSQKVDVYAIDVETGNNPCLGSITVNIPVDKEAPVISNVKVSNITTTGYTITCKVIDNTGVSRVQFPTWTEPQQDDLATDWGTNSAYTGTKNGDTYTYQVKFSEHNNEKSGYATHIYAYDNYGNQSSSSIEDYGYDRIAAQYTVSFNANNGTGEPSSQIKTHGKTLTLSSTKPTRTGYTFLGWATSSTATSAAYSAGGSFTTNANTTLYAVWKANTYTVSYNANGGAGEPSSQTKTYGKTLTLSSTKPTRTGYTFQGWSTSSSATSATYTAGGSYTANASATLYAVWKADPKQIHASTNSVNLTLGGTEATSIYVWTSGYYSGDYILNCHRSNSNISSSWGEWNSENKCPLTFTAKSRGPTTVTLSVKDKTTEAVIHSITVNVTVDAKQYTVSYNANGGSGAPSSQTKYHGTALTLSSTKPTRSGYTFQGWSTSSTATSATYSAGGSFTTNANTTLYAVWTANPTYTISYNANNGSGAPSSQTKVHGTSLTIPTTIPTRFPYTFLGWDTASSANTPDYYPGDSFTANANTTLYAVWQGAKAIGSNSLSANIPYGGVEYYYSFTPSVTDTYRFESNGSKDTQIYVYNTSGTQIAYNDDSGEDTNFLLNYDFTAGTNYYIKVKFYSRSTTGTIGFTMNRVFDITYNANGGSDAPAAQTKLLGTPLTLSSTVPTRTGYTFLGWATSASATSATYLAGDSFTANADTILYAVWKAHNYTVTYNANGGTGAPASQTKTYDKTLTLSSTKPIRAGYTFLGWSTSSTATSAAYSAGGSFTTNANTTLYAVWKANTYTITYNANGGTGGPASQTKTHDKTLTLSSTKPTRTGYTFLGWATSSSATSAAYSAGGSFTTNANTTLYAVWQHVCAQGHTYGEWSQTEAPTCIATGTERRDCSKCDHFETRTVSKVGHRYSSVVTDPTCTEDGYTTYTCIWCGNVYTGKHTAATNHSFGNWEQTKAPSCTTTGTERRDCSKCDHYETRTIAKLSHSYTAVVTEPTCTEAGYTTYTCACGDSYIADEVASLGHDIIDGLCDRCGEYFLTIVKQPKSVTVASGETAAVTVEAVGDGLTYTWYYKNPGASSFTRTTAFTGPTYSVAMTEARSGRQVYCLVKDQYGNKVQSDVVTLTMYKTPLAIVTQPESIEVKSGETAFVEFEAQGDGLTYTWYYKNKGAASFTKTSTFTGPSYSVAMSASRDGRQVYCLVTDQYGSKVKTDIVTLTITKTPLAILSQPESVEVKSGETALVEVEAQGDGLTYTWYYKNKSTTSFTKTTAFTGPSYSVTMSASRSGRQVYCLIKDENGNTVKTDVVTLTMYSTPLAIISQSGDVTVAEGETAMVTVEATGDDLTYEWYYKNDGASSYKKTSTFTGPVYTLEMNASRSGRWVYCKITDTYGNSVQTDPVVLTMETTPLELLSQPEGFTVAEGETGEIYVEATGDGLKYEWYYKNATASRFTKTSTFTGPEYSLTMSASRSGRHVYCKITDAYGKSVTTDIVALNMESQLELIECPEDVVAANGETVEITVFADGNGLKYAWYYRNAGKAEFTKTSTFKGDSYSLEMNSTRNGREVYCVITDSYGNAVATDVVTFRMG